MSILVSHDYSIPSHYIFKEGIPLPYYKNKHPVSNTVDPNIVLISIRKGFRIHHHYISVQRAKALALEVQDSFCE